MITLSLWLAAAMCHPVSPVCLLVWVHRDTSQRYCCLHRGPDVTGCLITVNRLAKPLWSSTFAFIGSVDGSYRRELGGLPTCLPPAGETGPVLVGDCCLPLCLLVVMWMVLNGGV
ncbi:hypothetical protein GGR56DRAFT_303320 [Xylariaceae sp. FL0804]|nr:hypothetical protein GGR56DRAFT_303320 [Xylariaceae sp. FL0804]